MSYLCVCFYYSNIIKVYSCGRSSDGVARTQLTGHLPIIGLFISFPFNPPISCLSLTCLIQSTNQLPLFDLCHSIHQSAVSFLRVSFNPPISWLFFTVPFNPPISCLFCLMPFYQPISCLFFTFVIQSTNQLPLFNCGIQSINQLTLFYLCHSINQSADSFLLVPFNPPISWLFFTCVIQSTNQLTLFVFYHSINQSAVSFWLVLFNLSISCPFWLVLFSLKISCLFFTCVIQSTNQLPLFVFCHSINQSAVSFWLVLFNPSISCLFLTCAVQFKNQLTLFYLCHSIPPSIAYSSNSVQSFNQLPLFD